MRKVAPFVLAAFAVCAIACNNGSVTPIDPSTLPPDTSLLPPSGAPQESYTASITDVSGTNFHDFTINTTSTAYVVIPAVTPSVTISVGFGVPTDVGCSLSFLKPVTAGPNFVIRQLSLPAGNYCIAVEDGSRVAPFTYTAQVWHQ